MSVVADIRKLLQDLVTPDLQALKTELKMHHEETNRRFDELSRAIAESRGEMRAEVRGVGERIIERLQMEQRLAALEEERNRKQLPEKQ